VPSDSAYDGPRCDNGQALGVDASSTRGRPTSKEDLMGKTGRKRRARKKKGANHGKRPNA